MDTRQLLPNKLLFFFPIVCQEALSGQPSVARKCFLLYQSFGSLASVSSCTLLHVSQTQSSLSKTEKHLVFLGVAFHLQGYNMNFRVLVTLRSFGKLLFADSNNLVLEQ